MNSKMLTLLGFAAKAGRLCYGMDTTVAAVKGGKARLVITAADISEKSRKEILFYRAKFNTEVILSDISIEQLSHAVGKRCGIISVNDEGFAKAIMNLAKNN